MRVGDLTVLQHMQKTYLIPDVWSSHQALDRGDVLMVVGEPVSVPYDRELPISCTTDLTPVVTRLGFCYVDLTLLMFFSDFTQV